MRSKPSLLSTQLRWFMLAMVLANMGGGMYEQLLPLYLKQLDADVVQIGLFFTLIQILPLILQILGGWISDSLGRLRSIAIGSVAGVFSYVAMILAPTWQWLLLGEGFLAITRSLVGPSFGAFVAEQSSEGNRSKVFGIVETVYMVVAVIGPPLGGTLAGAYGFRAMLLVAASFYLVAAVIRVSMARVAARGSESQPASLSLASLGATMGSVLALLLGGGLMTWIFITDGVSDVAYSLSFQLMPLYLENPGNLSVAQIGWLGSVFGAVCMLGGIPSGWFADKWGERLAIALGFGIHAVALVVFLCATGFWGYALSWGLFGLGNALRGPAYQSLISRAVPQKLRGTAFGLFRSSLGVFSLPAPAIGAQLWERVSPRFPFQLTMGALFAAMIPVWLKFKTPKTSESANVEAGPDASA
ncbi:MAG: MFS transporter [Anaerolineae bacterium]|nr:MFS transporter [Anaerolineae bacterium]